MSGEPIPDVLGFEVSAAALALAAFGMTVRLEPVSVAAGTSAARWRVARSRIEPGGHVVLAVVPEIEGRIICTNRSSRN